MFRSGSYQQLTGIALLVAAMLIVPFQDALAKVLSSKYPVVQIVWARFFFHFLIVLPIVLVKFGSRAITVANPSLQIGRGFCLMAASVCFFGSIKFIPLANAISITFFSAVIVVFLSAFLLKEKVTLSRSIASITGIFAVILITQPGFDTFHWASSLALASAFFFALYFLSTKLVSKETSSLITLAWQGFSGLFFSCLLIPFFWVTPTPTDFFIMFLVGIIGAFAHLLLIRAFEFADASLLAPFLYTEIIMQTTLGYLLFNEVPNYVAFSGIAIIISVGIYLSITTKYSDK